MKEQRRNLTKLSVIKENVKISDSEKLAALEKLLSKVENDIRSQEIRKEEPAQKSRLQRVMSGIISPTAFTMAGLYMCNMTGLINNEINSAESGVLMMLGLGLGLVWSLPACRTEDTKEYYKIKKEIKELKGDREQILNTINSLKGYVNGAKENLENKENSQPGTTE